MKTKRKFQIYLYVFLIMTAVYISLIIASAWDRELSILSCIMGLMDISYMPSCISFNTVFKKNPDVFLITLSIFLFVVALIVLLDMSKHELMQGQEYGTACWGNINSINKKYASNVTHENRIYSEKVRISMDCFKTRINNNVIAVGGSGTGKSLFLLTPNLYQADADSIYPGSYVITDPDGSLLRKNGSLLKKIGYNVKVISTISGLMDESDRIDIMPYIRRETDAFKLASVIFSNTKKPGESSKDPFFDNQAEQFLAAIILLVHMEHERFAIENTFCSVLDLINYADINPDEPSQLDGMFDRLAGELESEGKNPYRHAAYRTYKKATKGATETVLSVIATLNSRIGIFDNEEVRRIFSGNDIDLAAIGTGKVGGRQNVKTALFLEIPDADTTFNAIAGMVYTMLIQELYYQADRVYKGRLPIPVTFWFDEFANISLPENFPKVLATMRKRCMSAVIIIQNLAQIQDIYKGKMWESIVGNCDTFVYLGGNELSTFKYISENLGKKTIWKRSVTSRGHQGSSSTNDDVLGRELMLPTEVRELDNDNCIVMIRSEKPIIDKKFNTFAHEYYQLSGTLPEYDHVHERNKKNNISVSIIKNESPDIVIDIQADMQKRHPELSELYSIALENEKTEKKEKKININGIDLVTLLSRPDFFLSDEEIIEVTEGIKAGLTDQEIKSYILLGSAEKMRQKRLLITAIKARMEHKEADI